MLTDNTYQIVQQSCELVLQGRHMFTFLIWLLLLFFCWPLALVALLLYPLIRLFLLPFRIMGVAVEGALGLLWAVITFPARLLGAGPRRAW